MKGIIRFEALTEIDLEKISPTEFRTFVFGRLEYFQHETPVLSPQEIMLKVQVELKELVKKYPGLRGYVSQLAEEAGRTWIIEKGFDKLHFSKSEEPGTIKVRLDFAAL